ncbi:methyl-accepting chemotaxis protein [Shewanella sp. MEBiC00475]|uniref:methyl-accepting chemotaxis protein n=1 Tax=Shewanella sp. MEBiC00475 TaxID=2575361 RepID=UPI001585D29A|nr:methyl-accepting chemotaxis protein [Shewanella sp. MEBiC00475]
MNIWNSLKISHKIGLLASVAIFGFVIFFLYQQKLVSQTQSNILLLQHEYTPVLELLTNAKEGLNDVEKSLEGAVTTGEEDLLVEAKQKAADVRDILTNIEASNQNLNMPKNLIDLFDSYNKNKYFVASSLVSGDADFNVIGPRSQQANEALKALDKTLNDAVDIIHTVSNDVVAKTLEQNETSRMVGLVLGIILIVIMVVSGYLLTRSITSSIKQVTDSLRDIVEGEGDLTKRVEYSRKDEVSHLVYWFNEFINSMHNNISSTQETINTLEMVSSRLASTSMDSTQLIQSQDTAMASVMTAVQQLTTSVVSVAESALLASTEASNANDTAKEGRDVVESTVASINALAIDVNKTAGMVSEFELLANNAGEFLSTISRIADQTNLLALNAAIEAARAGEHGRGFAVVADEVRSLASHTQDATAQIKQALEEIQKGASSVVVAMNSGQQSVNTTVTESEKSGRSLDDITRKVERILSLNKQIADETDEQKVTYEAISNSITDANHISSSVRDGADVILHESKEIQNVTQRLGQVINQYKV